MAEGDTPPPPVPESKAVSRKRTISLVWAIPIVAALVSAWIAVTRVLGQGPKIVIVLPSAEGLEAGKTKIRYNGVDVGTVTTIRLSDDHMSVIATAQMAPRTDDFFVEDTKFWVVRPRISGANVTGLGTLISGAYIGMEIGSSKVEKREFWALAAEPVVYGAVPGRFFILKTSDLGSLDTGTTVYFRRLPVGEVASYQLDKDGKSVTVKVFVTAPYDQYVNPNTRFWHASGIDMSISANGLNLQTQSLLSILIGGVAFETPVTGPLLPPAEANATFTLYANRAQAFQPPPKNPQTYSLIFKESVRGLTPGAPVEFRGIPIGEVSAIRAQIDLNTFEFSVSVTISLDPERLGVNVLATESGADLDAMRTKLIEALVSHGVRAQLRTGNLLTGALYVSFDFFPNAPQVTVDWSQKPAQLPTMPGQLQATEASVESIINKLDKMPLKEIGDNLRKALADLDRTLVSARGTLDNTTNLTGPNSAQVQQLTDTLQELSRAARSVRVLADYLESHPETLIRGKKGQAK